MRPQSIINFDRCYLGVIAINVLNNILNWSAAKAQLNAAASTGVASSGALGTGLVVGAVVGIAINLLLWYFIAKKGSVVAKWILTVFFVIVVVALLWSAAQGTFPRGIAGIVTIVGMVLQAVAIYFLFRPDAQRWFDGKGNLENTFS